MAGHGFDHLADAGSAGVEETTPGGDRLRHAALAYGAVRIGHGDLAIGCESLPGVSQSQRALYQQAVNASNADPNAVLVVRVDETACEVDVIDFDDPNWPARTLRQRAGHVASCS